MIRTGGYYLREWPDAGGVMDQDNRLVEIFRVIKDEFSKIQQSKVK